MLNKFLPSWQISGGEHKQSFPFQSERYTQYIQDGMLYQNRSMERIVQRKVIKIVQICENYMPSNQATYP